MKLAVAQKLAKTERARFLVEALDLEAATDIAGAEWEGYQLDHLNDDGLFRHERKSRQVGWSWTSAAEAVANSMLYPGTTSLFVSINREESAEKIRYARQIYDALYPPWRVEVVGDNITALNFSNRSRVISMPQRPVRGKARAWVYLDEFAHYRLDRPIYIGSVPVTTKGGRIRIGSTTMGARGMFWEIGEQTVRRYPGYKRAITPWWAVKSLLRAEVTVRTASLLAPTMTTEERVERFASERIRDIYDNMPLDDFQQEYECFYVDETAAYISWADIAACTGDEAQLEHCWLTRTVADAHNAIDEMAAMVDAGQITGSLVWGLDIGRKKDLTELVIMELAGDTHIVRAVFSLDRQAFEIQYGLCRAVLDRLPIVRGYMDQNGLGMQLAETLYLRDGYGERAMPMAFSLQSKALMATHVKTRFQRRGSHSILIPNDRDLKYQIHSVRRNVSAANNITFDVEASERHHADKFWALALASEAGETVARVDGYDIAGNMTLRTARTMEALEPSIYAPDMPDGHDFSPDDLRAMLERGIGDTLSPLAVLGLPEHVQQQLWLPDAYRRAKLN